MLLRENDSRLTYIHRNTLSIDVKVTVTSYAWLRLKGQNQAIFIHVRLQKGEVRLREEPNLEEGLQA